MPDRVQDLTNHRKVAVACKNYTDQKAEEILWQLAENDVSTSDDNTTASTKTVPANATRCKIKRIYGLTQKFSPSVASDSTSYSVKTMPSTVYDFDVSKVDGKSEVSENLIVLNDVAETTLSQGLTYKVQNGKVYFNGTLTDNIYLYLNLANSITVNNSGYSSLSGFTQSINTQWYLTSNNSGSINGDRSANPFIQNSQSKTDVNLENNQGHNTYTQIYIYISSGLSFSNTVFTPMLVSGSTAPTEFKVGYDGIHNLELSGLKVEGENLIGLQDVAQTITNGITYSVKDGVITLNGTTSVNYWAINLSIPTVYAGTYYGTTFATSNPSNSAVYLGTTQSIYGNITTTTSYTNIRIYIHNINTVVNNWVIKPMLVRGNQQPTEFIPYISPTTKTIDLSTILYNGSPLFEDNSLKAVGTAKDYITPYKAHKEIKAITLDGSDTTGWTINTTNGNYTLQMTVEDILTSGNRDSIIASYLEPSATAYNDNTINRYNNILFINIGGNTLTSVNAYATYLQNKPLTIQYILATPIEVSIDWSATLRGIQGYSNGTITLLNTNNQDTDNTITYNSIIKENCCAKIVQSRGGNVVKIINLPTTASDGWSAGSQYNYRDLTTSKRIGNVNKNSNLGSLNWTYDSANQIFQVAFAQTKNISADTLGNLVCNIYTTMIWNQLSNKGIATAVGYLRVKDNNYTNASDFKTSLTNEPLYYELVDASKTETSIDSVDNVIEVEPSDVLSFYDENDNLVTVPSDLTYRIEVAR